MNAPLPQPLTEAAVVDLWLRDRPSTTRRAYLTDYGVLASWAGKPLALITIEDLFRFSTELTGAPASRCRRIAAVKSLMSFAVRVGALALDPSRSIRLPRTSKNLTERVLREDEVVDLIKEARRGRDQALLRTLYISGVRISEALGLRWQDVGRRWLTVAGKGSKPRTVLVPGRLVADLRKLKDRAESEEGFVFKGRGGRPISTGYARRIVKTAGMEALGKPVAPHWMRHSHACKAVENGVPIHVLQASLGHFSIATTSLYLHARPNQGSSQYIGLR